MRLLKKILYLNLIFLLSACAGSNTKKNSNFKEKRYFSSSGFALIYEEGFYANDIVNKKINNDSIVIAHSFLRRNTPIIITNPLNSKTLKAKITKRASYPKIFNIVLSKKAAEFLSLDPMNPFIEIIEVKKNITFIAKEGSIFDEEKNVADIAPVDEIKVDDLSKSTKLKIKKKNIKTNFFIVISEFYYQNSATNLKKELIKKIKTDVFSVIKINDTKYRLAAGPFKDFNALKLAYISLNNLGFENLNILRK